MTFNNSRLTFRGVRPTKKHEINRGGFSAYSFNGPSLQLKARGNHFPLAFTGENISWLGFPQEESNNSLSCNGILLLWWILHVKCHWFQKEFHTPMHMSKLWIYGAFHLSMLSYRVLTQNHVVKTAWGKNKTHKRPGTLRTEHKFISRCHWGLLRVACRLQHSNLGKLRKAFLGSTV